MDKSAKYDSKGLIKGSHISPSTEFKKGHSPVVPSKENLIKRGKKLSIALKGHTVSQETRDKISNKLKGVRIGPLNHKWKGENRTMTIYLTIRNCYRYQQWRSSVYERDMYTCQNCGDSKGNNLNAHHLFSFASILKKNNIKSLDEGTSCEELWNVNNGQTLCKPCHKLTDSYLNPKKT